MFWAHVLGEKKTVPLAKPNHTPAKEDGLAKGTSLAGELGNTKTPKGSFSIFLCRFCEFPRGKKNT